MKRIIVAAAIVAALLLAASAPVWAAGKVPQGSAGVSTRCDRITFNFTGAGPGVRQSATVDHTTKRPARLNGSVTFSGLAPGEHPVRYRSGTNRQRGSFEALPCHR